MARRRRKETGAIPPLSEARWQSQVIALAAYLGWRVYHTHDSRRSAAGYPDLTMVHPRKRRLVMAELKKDGEEPTPEQRLWIEDLRAAGVEVWVWRPADIEDVKRTLLRGD